MGSILRGSRMFLQMTAIRILNCIGNKERTVRGLDAPNWSYGVLQEACGSETSLWDLLSLLG